MLRSFIATVTSVVLLASTASIAQTQQPSQIQQPTSTDTKAAYCLIINANALAIQKKLLTQVPLEDTDTRKQAQLPIDETTQRVARIEGYLYPRVPHLDQAPLTAAQRQADDDLKAISSESVRACTQQCGGLPQTQEQIPAYAACTSKCAPESLSRVRACTELSWLPQ
jgi:hypothetical protein